MRISILILFFMISGCKAFNHLSNNKIDFERYADTENISLFEVLKILKVIDRQLVQICLEIHL